MTEARRGAGIAGEEHRSAEPDRSELAAFVRRNVADVRVANGLVLAWFRVFLRTLTVILYAYAWIWYREAPMPVAIGINLAHILVAVAVLWFLLRRRAVVAAIGIGAISDFVAVFIGAWRAAGGSDAQTGTVYFMGVFELMLLFASLTLPRRSVGLFAVLCCAYMAVLTRRADLSVSAIALVLITMVAFSLAVIWAGTRLVDLAARTAVEVYTGGLLRRHRDELQRAEEALRRAQAQAETLTQLIVHDLRNPVATVGVSLDVVGQVLAAHPAAADASEALGIARDEVRRLAEMIGDLLVVSRLEEGLLARTAPVDFRALLEGVARAADGRAREIGARLEVRSAEGVARVDEALVRRMIDNLLANAFRHVPSGGRIELSAEWAEGCLRLAVRNSGPPVPAELREQIFEKHATHGRREWLNAGLGLYLCRLVAEAHGGSVGLRDRPGWNVSFEVELPGAQA